jgi:hypothetical protein
MPLPEIPPPIRGVARLSSVSTSASYQPLADSAKSLMLEVWGPRFVSPWANACVATVPLVVVPDERGEKRAPADVIVNGRAEFRRAGDEPVLLEGDVLSNPLSDATFRVPTAQRPAWRVERATHLDRDEYLGLLERQAALTEFQMSSNEPRLLLGAARAFRLGALRCVWHGPFVTAARWSWTNTTPASMSWHLWQLLASPAGFALERFSGTPHDDTDFAQLIEVIERFPAPRLNEVTIESNQSFETSSPAGVTLRRAPLPWLRIDGELPTGVSVESPSNRPLLKWRQLIALRINGRTPDDRCLWHDGLAVELREGDVISWAGGEARLKR